MSLPKAYGPIPGFSYQLLGRKRGRKEWDSMGHSRGRIESLAALSGLDRRYGMEYEFKAVRVPRRYWRGAAVPVQLDLDLLNEEA